MAIDWLICGSECQHVKGPRAGAVTFSCQVSELDSQPKEKEKNPGELNLLKTNQFRSGPE